MKNDWKPLNIKAKELESKIKSGELQIPAYQRGVVWTSSMQKELIDSIKNGYPFGSLVIFSYHQKGMPDLLIDGLQRSTALFKFINNPSVFFDENDISDDCLDQLLNMMVGSFSSKGVKEKLKNIIITWVKQFKTSDAVRSMNEYECAQLIMQEFPAINVDADIIFVLNRVSSIIKPVFDQYKALCTIVEEKDIPYIEISGDDDNLSEIFFRINDRGVKLNKQNKFAATWSNTPIKITNENLFSLVNLVKDRYDKISSDGTAIYGYDAVEFLRKKELDAFELTYAFGKKITSEFPELFVYKNDIVAVDAVPFTLLNACLLGTKDTLKEMNQLLLQRFETSEKINEFLIKVLSCIKYVDELLAPVTKFKSNKRLNKSPLHTEFQIVSLIASVFRMKYVVKDNEQYIFNLSRVNSDWNNISKLLQNNALKKYIYDIIDGRWAGHGDNTLDSIIHDNYDIYTREIQKSDFAMTLRTWYTNQKSERREWQASDVTSPKEAEKVLLSLIYANSFTAADQLSIEKFDIEHLATKNLMELKLRQYNGLLKLPISSFGNICLLPEYNNRKKKDKTIYDDNDYTDKLGNALTINDIEDRYTFTEKKDMEWLQANNLSKEEFAARYLEFIDSRFEKMLKKVTDILY